MFDFAENLIAQQRAFAKQMLQAASKGQQTITPPTLPTPTLASPAGPPACPAPRSARPDDPPPRPTGTPGS